MAFKVYGNMMRNASRNVAAGIFIVGLMLIGFGILVVALKEIVVWILSSLFFLAAFGCFVTAIKIFIAAGRMSSNDVYRENVNIHIHHDDTDI